MLELKYRYSKQCTLHETLIPKRTFLHGKAGFWLKDLDQYKNNNIGLVIPKKEQKVDEKKETAEVLESKKDRKSY